MGIFMHKILIADDERIIREGISKLVDWKGLDLELVDMAHNGDDAYNKILLYKPDIVITDVKMPGLNGLELIETVRKQNETVKFIILSGYGEFNLAKKAMEFGVRHYLLKPTEECEIKKVIREVLDELELEREKDEFMSAIKQEKESMLPLAKEQFIRDRALNKLYSNDEMAFYKKMFGIENCVLKVILFELDEDFSIEEMYAIERITVKELSDCGLFFKTSIKNTLLVLIGNDYDEKKLYEGINSIKATFYKYYKTDPTVSVSSDNMIDKLHVLYLEASHLLKYKFHLGEGSIIRNEDIRDDRKLRILNNYYFLIDQIVIFVKCGDTDNSLRSIDEFINEIRNEKLEQDIIVSYSMELMLSIMRNNFDNINDGSNKGKNEHLESIIGVKNLKTIDSVARYIKEFASGISDANFKTLEHRRNRLVQMLLKKIDENIGNEELSLKWLSENHVFANVDYLSKLFKKEMKMNFAQYVINTRMEMAKNLIRSYGDDRIYEIAYKVGFGHNSQYFSQVFKSYTGMSPSEYKRSLENANLRGENEK
jgi:two-component system, response regulator YesN